MFVVSITHVRQTPVSTPYLRSRERAATVDISALKAGVYLIAGPYIGGEASSR